jgi:hypothetical protein
LGSVTEDVAGVATGEGTEILLPHTDALGDETGGMGHVLRLVPLRADRLRTQVRGVGLDENALRVEDLQDLRCPAVLVGGVPGESHVITTFDGLPSLALPALEAVQDYRDPGAGEDSHRIGESLSGVDDQWQARVVGQRNRVLEQRPLDLLRPISPIIIQPHLAQRHDSRRLRQLRQRFEVRRRISPRVVWVNSRRRVHVRQCRRELRPFLRILHVRPHVDDGDHPCLLRPLDRLLRRDLQPREVRVRIYKHKFNSREPVPGAL